MSSPLSTEPLEKATAELVSAIGLAQASAAPAGTLIEADRPLLRYFGACQVFEGCQGVAGASVEQLVQTFLRAATSLEQSIQRETPTLQEVCRQCSLARPACSTDQCLLPG